MQRFTSTNTDNNIVLWIYLCLIFVSMYVWEQASQTTSNVASLIVLFVRQKHIVSVLLKVVIKRVVSFRCNAIFWSLAINKNGAAQRSLPYIYICVYMFIYAYVFACVHIYIYMYACTYACTWIYVHMYLCMYMHVYG